MDKESLKAIQTGVDTLFPEWWEEHKKIPSLKAVFEAMFREGDKNRQWEDFVKTVAKSAFHAGVIEALKAASRGMTLLRMMGATPPGSINIGPM